MMKTRKISRRRGVCGVCGEPIFLLDASLPGLGQRQWWHESYTLDGIHAARPDKQTLVASGGIMRRLLGGAV